MSSLLTNASAMTALQTLSTINKNLSTTQSRIATGLRVAEASDNSAYWSIATTMRSDNKANSVVRDALGLGAGKVDTAYTAMNDALGVMDKIKEKLLLAKGASEEDQGKIAAEIAVYQQHLTAVAEGANYAGSNLLNNDPADGTTISILSSFNRSSDGTVSTDTIDITLANTRLIDTAGGAAILDDVLDTAAFFVGAAAVATDTEIDGWLVEVETAFQAMSTGAAELGAAKTRIDLQSNFVKALSDAMDRGIGQLVDADMNEESTRLQALQVQQQLGIQALSIANSNSQSILSLFR